jgi:hypothetical protein
VKLIVEPETTACTIQWVDAVGRIVKTENLSANGLEILANLSLEGLANGSYMLKISLLDEYGATKTLVQRLQVR